MRPLTPGAGSSTVQWASTQDFERGNSNSTALFTTRSPHSCSAISNRRAQASGPDFTTCDVTATTRCPVLSRQVTLSPPEAGNTYSEPGVCTELRKPCKFLGTWKASPPG